MLSFCEFAISYGFTDLRMHGFRKKKKNIHLAVHIEVESAHSVRIECGGHLRKDNLIFGPERTGDPGKNIKKAF